jgi:DNA polymerase-3 subunit gamma/tau
MASSSSKVGSSIAASPTTAPFEGSLALNPIAAPAPHPGPQLVHPPLDLESLQNVVVDALSAAKGQQSAADKIADSTWTATSDTLTIQTTISATMLPLLINADATSIIKLVLAQHNVKLRLNILPGAANAAATPKPKRAAASGSVQQLAENHPIVQQAQKLFSAEIRNIIDLRDKD